MSEATDDAPTMIRDETTCTIKPLTSIITLFFIETKQIIKHIETVVYLADMKRMKGEYYH